MSRPELVTWEQQGPILPHKGRVLAAFLFGLVCFLSTLAVLAVFLPALIDGLLR